jgi:hypothetical protein
MFEITTVCTARMFGQIYLKQGKSGGCFLTGTNSILSFFMIVTKVIFTTGGVFAASIFVI